MKDFFLLYLLVELVRIIPNVLREITRIVANGGYFGAPLAIQSVHYDGYHGVL